MKRFIFISVAVVAVAIGAVINVGLNLAKSNNPSSLTLANIDSIEAFAEGGEGSNNSGSGNMYYYTDKQGKPENCTLYKFVNANGSVQYSDSTAGFGAGWTWVQVTGIKELCPKTGNGCTVYSCHVTNNTNP